jgi:hypothetical protein
MTSLHFIKDKTLKERLEQAFVCCKSCGEKYGEYSTGYSSTWIGLCHVCGEENVVTETRDWGYLIQGILLEAKEEEKRAEEEEELSLDNLFEDPDGLWAQEESDDYLD